MTWTCNLGHRPTQCLPLSTYRCKLTLTISSIPAFHETLLSQHQHPDITAHKRTMPSHELTLGPSSHPMKHTSSIDTDTTPTTQLSATAPPSSSPTKASTTTPPSKTELTTQSNGRSATSTTAQSADSIVSTGLNWGSSIARIERRCEAVASAISFNLRE